MALLYRQGYSRDESELLAIKQLVDGPLSEPYSIFCYRYFLHSFPDLCHSAYCDGSLVGVVIGRIIVHRGASRGYIAMLAVEPAFRNRGIGRELTRRIIETMVEGQVHEIVLETEANNESALRLYENFGFIRDKLLVRYYMNGSDAFRLKLPLRPRPKPTDSNK